MGLQKFNGGGSIRELGVLSAATNSNATMGGASATVLLANPNRAYASFRNTDGTNSVYLAFGTAAVLLTGVLLRPYETYVMSPATGNLFLGRIYGIGTAGTPVVAVIEGV